MNDRILTLRNLLNDDPDDPFLHYALGLEYLKIHESELAIEKFNWIMHNHPDYLAVYYHAALVLSETGQLEMAEDVYKKGIALAERMQSYKTLQELKNAYHNFLLEMDD